GRDTGVPLGPSEDAAAGTGCDASRRLLVQGAEGGLGDILHGALGVDVEDAALVVVDQRCGLLAVDLQAGADRGLVVVVTATGEHALHHDVLGDLVVDHRVQL